MTMTNFAAELAARAKDKGPIIVGLAGAGQMGTDIVVQVGLMPGMRIGAVAEHRTNRAIDAALMAGWAKGDIVETNTANGIDAAIESGKIAVTQDLEALAAAGRIDVVIDATGNPNIGANFALAAMRHKKHVVMLNVEADITIGRMLKAEASRQGVVYTGAAGDEPAATMELIGFVQSLGMTIVAAGKGKNNPLKFDATPDQYEEEARARQMNARMLVEFVDGSKTMIEMVAVANATGLVPDKPGMHGPAATREELAHVLCPVSHGGVLSRKGVVDYSIGKGVAPGVFVIVEGRHPRVTERLADLKVGKGPFFSILRPYHLTSLETPLSAARAVVHGTADLQPLDHPVAEAVAVAKRDLTPGMTMGMIGEYDYRAWAMTWADARKGRAVPIGLVEKAKVVKPIKAGEPLTYDNVAIDETMTISRMRRELDLADARFLPADAA
jgi:predicted homoserine dehydrogenase-like protein